MRAPHWAAFALLVSLAACANPPPPPAPIADAPPPPPVQTPPGPTGAGGPVHATRPYDGLYTGGLALLNSASQYDCPRADNDQATMRVEGGHATIDLSQGTSLTGDVVRGGRLSLVSQGGPSTTIMGHFSRTGFVTIRSVGKCRYSMQLTKQGT